ncbi:MAG TPA: phosphatase [Acidimicrobiales bacterium]|nr:phosphatase [Acidimicrobiales bacterium]
MTDHDLLAHLVASRLAGRVATRSSNSLRNAARLVEGDPDCTMGLDDWRDADLAEVLAAVHAAGGRELDPEAAEHPDGGYIEPEVTLDGIRRHRGALADFVAAGGGRVVVATGHPVLLGHYVALVAALASAGCRMLRPLEGVEDVLTTPEGRPCSVGYVDGVAVLAYDGHEHHTHRSLYMEAMLDAAGGRDGVDLVIADHGFAGAAVEAGIETLSIADINDPALPLAQARGRTAGVLLIDDGLDPSVFVPVTEAVLAGVRHSGANVERST